ncbi:MAG: hypothetical protein NVV66_16470 [Cellulomonas sp.]|uniref:hypothetical protein n=1 Tax=Cellulomonas sp. TaxID=40001 RepID=UPI00258434FC|nr:hypothetical protein [Cellulomonas sp.]MCR6706210.1 hypothetical protein [Cellulomonas sp.]
MLSAEEFVPPREKAVKIAQIVVDEHTKRFHAHWTEDAVATKPRLVAMIRGAIPEDLDVFTGTYKANWKAKLRTKERVARIAKGRGVEETDAFVADVLAEMGPGPLQSKRAIEELVESGGLEAFLPEPTDDRFASAPVVTDGDDDVPQGDEPDFDVPPEPDCAPEAGYVAPVTELLTTDQPAAEAPTSKALSTDEGADEPVTAIWREVEHRSAMVRLNALQWSRWRAHTDPSRYVEGLLDAGEVALVA